jgi:AraC-like DNA-binding protein
LRHAFREATATSPLRYLKSICLHEVRALLVAEGLEAQDAARRVGYASASRFSREYRRPLGASPGSERAAVLVYQLVACPPPVSRRRPF